MAKVSYLSLIILCLWISFFQIISKNINVGEFIGFKVSLEVIEVFYIVLITTLLFILFLFIDYLLNRKRVFFSKSFKFHIDNKKLNYAFLFLLISQLAFLALTGVGRLLSDATHPLSPLFSILSPEAFFPIYYLLCRKTLVGERNCFFFVNVALFSSLKLFQGWSGFILLIFFLEYFYQTKHIKLNIKNLSVAFLIPLLILCLGGVIYTYVYDFKNQVRGTPVDSLTYSQGISHLASRLSMLPVAVAAKDREISIVKIFNEESTEFKEIVSLGRPILPRFIMPNKDFLPLGNDVLRAYYSNITNKTSSNVGLYMYLNILYLSDFIQFYIYLLLVVFLIFLAKLFINSIEQFNCQLDFVLFLILINVVDIASLEIVFGYGFFKAISVFVFCWFLGGFKLNINSIPYMQKRL